MKLRRGKEEKMRNKMILVLCLIILVTWGCRSKAPSKDVFPETYPNVQDNDKNIVWIKSHERLSITLILIQKWIDEHPLKRVISVSSGYMGSNSCQTGWLIIYEDR